MPRYEFASYKPNCSRRSAWVFKINPGPEYTNQTEKDKLDRREGGGDSLSKLNPHRLPKSLVRIGLVPLRESLQPVTVVGGWGQKGMLGLGLVLTK